MVFFFGVCEEGWEVYLLFLLKYSCKVIRIKTNSLIKQFLKKDIVEFNLKFSKDNKILFYYEGLWG